MKVWELIKSLSKEVAGNETTVNVCVKKETVKQLLKDINFSEDDYILINVNNIDDIEQIDKNLTQIRINEFTYFDKLR